MKAITKIITNAEIMYIHFRIRFLRLPYELEG